MPGANIQLRLGIFLLAALLVTGLSSWLINGMSISPDMEHRLESPSPGHWLGTGPMGRDMLSCLIFGTGLSMLTGVIVVTVSSLVGGFLGIIAGAARGTGKTGRMADSILTGIVDVLLAFPGFLLAVGLAAFMRGGLVNLVLVLIIPGWVSYARISRSRVLQYNSALFVAAARGYNASFFRVVFRHLLPLALPLIVVQASLDLPGIIIAESGLNFLGIGLDPAIPTLGQLVDAGRNHLFDHPILVIAPGLVLFLMITAFHLLGEGIKKTFQDFLP